MLCFRVGRDQNRAWIQIEEKLAKVGVADAADLAAALAAAGGSAKLNAALAEAGLAMVGTDSFLQAALHDMDHP